MFFLPGHPVSAAATVAAGFPLSENGFVSLVFAASVRNAFVLFAALVLRKMVICALNIHAHGVCVCVGECVARSATEVPMTIS